MNSKRTYLTLKVDQQYVQDVCQNQVQKYKRTVDEVLESLRGIVKDVIKYQAGILSPTDMADMEKSLKEEGSPEAIVEEYINRGYLGKIDSLKRKKKEGDEIIQRVNDFADTVFSLLSDQAKQAMAQAQEDRMERSLRPQILADINNHIQAASSDNKIEMSLERNLDLLYSEDMVQHLIRLRLGDPNIQSSYMRHNVEQEAIEQGNRLWLGLYELSDLKAYDLQSVRRTFADKLKNRLQTLTASQREKEICVSVRSFARDGSGHYTLLTLQPDPEKPNQFIMHSVNSIVAQDDNLMVHGIEGEFNAVAKSAGFEVSYCLNKPLIHQPTNQSCGPTHIEIVSAVMTQTSFFGDVPENYLAHASVKPTADHLLHVSNIHYCDLMQNEVTAKAIIARGQADSIFKLVIPGRQQNNFGFVPPTIKHLQQAKIFSTIEEEERKAKVPAPIIKEKSKAAAGLLAFLGLAVIVAPIVALACLTPLSVGVLVAIGIGCFIVGALMMVYGLNVVTRNKHSATDAANHPSRTELSTHAKLNAMPEGKRSKQKIIADTANVPAAAISSSTQNRAASQSTSSVIERTVFRPS